MVDGYPVLAKHADKVIVTQGTTNDDRQLEFYPPWETDNPNPGKITIELFKDMKGKELRDAVAGDMLHYLGATDPSSNKPIDPSFLKMKKDVQAARSPQNEQMDQREFLAAKKRGETSESYQDWLDNSRIDAYIRGYVTPDKEDEWRKNGIYDTPRMKQAIEKIKKYVTDRAVAKP